jgi:hypothetical protein
LTSERRTAGLVQNVALLLVTAGALSAAGLASSWGSLPLLAALVALLVWLPGVAILDFARVRTRALDDLALALVLGGIGAAAAYWLTARLGLRPLFLAWPVAGLAFAYRNRARQGERLRGFADALQRPTTAIPLAVVALSLAPYLFLPLFYSNLRPLPDGGFAFYNMPDLVLHASLSGELTRTMPPGWPYLAGRPATYHYAMDLLPAVFAAGGMSVLDGCVRLVPTLLTASTALALFALGRDWLGSPRAAAAATVLAFFGEDLSWIPGALEGQGVPWATAYFAMPTTVSLYMLNPMLPALGALAGALLCLRCGLRGEGGAWLALAAGLVLAVAEYKVFAAMHLLAALGIAGAVLFWRHRDRRLLAFVAVCGLLLVPAALALSGGAATRVQVLLRPWPYVPGALVRVGLWNAPWLAPLRAAWEGGFDLPGFAQYLVAALGYVIAAMGVRMLALGALVRALREDGVRLALAVFVLLGPILTLTCSVVVPGLPPAEQYNNAVWFFVQAKYLAWLFVVEVLRRWGAALGPAARTLLWSGALGAALASGVQYLGYQLAVRQEGKLTPAMMEVVRALAKSRPGEVVWAPVYVTEPVVVLTAAHGVSLDIFPYIVLSPGAIAETRAAQQQFWQLWRSGVYDPAPVIAWKARYVVADRLDGSPPAGAAQAPRAALRKLLENSEYTLFEVLP